MGIHQAIGELFSKGKKKKTGIKHGPSWPAPPPPPPPPPPSHWFDDLIDEIDEKVMDDLTDEERDQLKIDLIHMKLKYASGK